MNDQRKKKIEVIVRRSLEDVEEALDCLYAEMESDFSSLAEVSHEAFDASEAEAVTDLILHRLKALPLSEEEKS